MKKYTVLAVGLALLFYSCKEEPFCDIQEFTPPPQEQLNQEVTQIESYLFENNLDAEAHYTGIRYIINEPGSGRTPDACTTVEVSYVGSLLDGTVFNETPENQFATFRLENLIPGWQIGIPLIKEGGSITLFIPSGYAYGDIPVGDIPANSTLIFDIYLKSVTSNL